ncbi:MAG: low temperature requirement protein A [Chloroflexota bacterium]|nr:low temperature requirement protein A [Chloroflexota bacterium]
MSTPIARISDVIPSVEPERRASWLELFFDLCFVVAVGAVAQTLHGNPSLAGLTTFVALFVPVWWAWLEYAWYATSFPEEGLANRLGAFAAMLAILAMAARVGSASDGDPSGFIVGFVVFHVIVVLLFLRATRLYPERHDFALRYAIGFSLAASVWLGSLAVPEEMRPWIWAAALLIDLVNPAVAVQSVRGMTYDVSHIPERYGLFTLIVLGEAIIAVARGTSEAEWNPAAVTAALAGFVLAVVIWMAYFAHPHAELLERGRLAAFVWGYGHIFVWAGIAITGVGIELAIEAAEAGHGFPLAERLILCGGPALYVASMALLRAAGAGHITDRVVLIRLGTAIVSLVVGFLGGGLAPELFTVIVAAIAIAAGLAISAVWRTAPAATT